MSRSGYRQIAIVCLLLVFASGAVALFIQERRSEVLVTADLESSTPETSSPPEATDAHLALEATDAHLVLEAIKAQGGPAGTERVVLVFDDILPTTRVVHVASLGRTHLDSAHLRSVDPSAVSYRSQGPGDVLHFCGYVHGGGGTRGTAKSIDLLLPGNWFAADAGPHEDAFWLDISGNVAKIIVCPERDGFVQVAVIHPASVQAANVAVTVEDNTVVLEVEPDTAH